MFSGGSKFLAVWDSGNAECLSTAFNFAWVKWSWVKGELMVLSRCQVTSVSWYKFLPDIFSLVSSLASYSCASQWGSHQNTCFTRRKIHLQEPCSENRLALKGWTGTCPKWCLTFSFSITASLWTGSCGDRQDAFMGGLATGEASDVKQCFYFLLSYSRLHCWHLPLRMTALKQLRTWIIPQKWVVTHQKVPFLLHLLSRELWIQVCFLGCFFSSIL